MTDPGTLASVIESTEPLMRRYLAGFTDETRTAQAPGLPNHAIWTLGHLALYLRRAAERVRDTAPLAPPSPEFVAGDGRGGDERRFDAESVCFGSVPVATASLYPPLERGIAIFGAANAGFADAVRGATPERLATETAWGRRTLTVARLAEHMIFHNATHTGQIVDLRRALGMKPLI